MKFEFVRIMINTKIFHFRTITKEFEAYDMNALTGDIGGLVGLYAGASLLSLFDLACDVAEKVFHLFANKKT